MKDTNANKYQRPTADQYEALKGLKRECRQAKLFKLETRAKLVTK